MSYRIKSLAGVIIIMLAAGLGGYYFGHLLLGRNPFLNFAEVVPGTLFRSGELKLADLEKVVAVHEIQTIVCLSGRENSQIEAYARKQGLNLVGIQMRANRPPGPDRLGLALKIISGQGFRRQDSSWLLEDYVGPETDPVKLPGPYLLHCQAGADRTGYVVAVYRICFEGWSPDSARMEMLRYYHLPLKFPRLWEELEKIVPDQFCPPFNPGFPAGGPARP